MAAVCAPRPGHRRDSAATSPAIPCRSHPGHAASSPTRRISDVFSSDVLHVAIVWPWNQPRSKSSAFAAVVSSRRNPIHSMNSGGAPRRRKSSSSEPSSDCRWKLVWPRMLTRCREISGDSRATAISCTNMSSRFTGASFRRRSCRTAICGSHPPLQPWWTDQRFPNRFRNRFRGWRRGAPGAVWCYPDTRDIYSARCCWPPWLQCAA